MYQRYPEASHQRKNLDQKDTPGTLRLQQQQVQSKQHRSKGAIRKGMGMVAGVADMTYLSNPVTFLEFKVDKGRQSDAQKQWQQLVESHGFRYEIIRSQAEFCRAVGIDLSGA